MRKPNSFFKNHRLSSSPIFLVVSLVMTYFGAMLSTSHALIIKGGDNQNYRFMDPALGPLNTAPPNPIFIGKDLDLSGVAVSAMNGGSSHFGGAMMISPHYFVTATHYYGATSYNFRNRDGVMITKATDGGRPMVTTYPNGTSTTSDLYIGKLAGAGITPADKISIYPIVMESTNNWNWYIGKQIFIYSMNGGNSVGINTITTVEDSGPPGLSGKSITFKYTGAYTNQAGVNGESGSPWGFLWNGQFCAGGAHSAYSGVASLTTTFTSISTFIPAFADKIDAYMAESHPGEILTRLEVFNDAPEVTGNRNIIIQGPATSETLNLTYVDDNLPVNAVRTLTATSSNQVVLPNSALVLSGAGSARTLTITPPVGANGTAVVSLVSSDGEASATKTFTVTVIGSTTMDYPAASTDDAEQALDGIVTLTNPELHLGGGRMTGLRFPKLYVPLGAIVTSASVQFTAGAPQSGPAALEIFVQDAFYAAPFVDNPNPSNISSRTLKSTSVLWQPADWTIAGERGIAQRTPDVTALVQQAIKNTYWAFGQPMVFVFKGTGDRFAHAQEKVGGTTAQLTVTFRQPTQSNSTTLTVSSSSDDAEESNSGAVNLSDSDLELVNDGVAGDQTVGVRFNSVTLPAGVILTSAVVQFATDEPSSGSASLVIRAQHADSATTFNTTTNNLSSRPKTVASIPWTVTNWLTAGDQNYAQVTPDLFSIVSEVFNKPGWSNGNPLALFFTGTGRRTADAFDDNLAIPPKLKLTYIATPHPYSYEAWSRALPVLTTSQRSRDADPDGDQISNLLEFATGLDPSVPNASPITLQRSLNQFQIFYNRPRTTYGITYVIEWTDDLTTNSWSSVGTTQQVIAENGAMQTFRANIPMLQNTGDIAPKRFARMRVQ